MTRRLSLVLVPAGAMLLALGLTAQSRGAQLNATPNDFSSVILSHRLTTDCAVTGSLSDGKATEGEAIYTKRCAKCHGATGDGLGVAIKALEHKPKPWNTKETWEKTSDSLKFQATKCGGKAATLSEDMPDYPMLSDQEIWNVLAYAKTLQSAGAKP